jgi:hypothetical protein
VTNLFKLTGTESGAELVEQLIALRLMARRMLCTQDIGRAKRAEWQRVATHLPGTPEAGQAVALIAQLDEYQLQMKFEIIEIGNYLMPLCGALDAKAARDTILDALEVNHADRDSDDMRKYGGKTMHIIGALALENSATKDDGIQTKPLKWCQTMAFMHALQSNEKLDRGIHDEANKFFGGAFGEYQERPLLERLAGQGVAR